MAKSRVCQLFGKSIFLVLVKVRCDLIKNVKISKNTKQKAANGW